MPKTIVKFWFNSKIVKIFGDFFSGHVCEMLIISIVINIITALIKLYLGITIPSYLFGFNAGYYITLCIARILLLNQLREINMISDLTDIQKFNMELRVFGNMGKITVLLGIIYFICSLQLIHTDEITIYKGYVVYYVALVAFTKLLMAVYGKIMQRKFQRPIMAALKQMSFTDALVSIVVTQCTLLAMKEIKTANTWSADLGLIVSVVIIVQGILMIRKKCVTDN